MDSESSGSSTSVKRWQQTHSSCRRDSCSCFVSGDAVAAKLQSTSLITHTLLTRCVQEPISTQLGVASVQLPLLQGELRVQRILVGAHVDVAKAARRKGAGRHDVIVHLVTVQDVGLLEGGEREREMVAGHSKGGVEGHALGVGCAVGVEGVLRERVHVIVLTEQRL